LSSCEIYECLPKEKKDRVPFLRQKPRPKKGKTAFSCEAAADLTSSEKGSFFKQDEWLQEIEGHERKEASQMIRRLITPRNKLLDRSWKQLFLNEIVPHRRENLSVSCYLSNYYCSRKLVPSFITQHFICSTPRCRLSHCGRNSIFPSFSI